MADAADEAREFIRQALAKTGLSPYKLARLAGIASTTITRPLNDPTFKFIPKQATMAKIAEAAGLTPPKLSEPSLKVEPVTQWVPLIGEVRAGAWAEIPPEPVVEETIPVHLPEYQRASLFAVRVAGRSMDLRYVEGTVVIALPPAEIGVRVGDNVVVRRCRSGLAETTLKELVQEADGSYSLHPRSSDPSFQPIPLARNRDADDGPEVIGVVVYSINPERSGRGPLVSLD
jgi:SOS-response transcriptional repressor LexA